MYFPWRTEALVDAIERQDWDALLGLRQQVRSHLFRRAPFSNGAHWVAQHCSRRVRPLRFLLCLRGTSVALLAPDGGGKSTLAKSLSADPHLRAKVIYAGMNPAARAAGMVLQRSQRVKPCRKHGRWDMMRGLRFSKRLLEQWYRIAQATSFRAKGRIVVFDRYVYDSWLANRPNGIWKRFRRALLQLGWPNPDLVVVLDAPAQVLYARKQEHTLEWLERQRQGYLRLSELLPQAFVVDATHDANHVAREVTSLIWAVHNSRFAAKL
jgi:thymidylate kinase